METIKIKSSLYDYSVDFPNSYQEVLEQIEGPVAYVIDRNVYSLYSSGFKNIDKQTVYLMDAVESKKNMDIVMDIIMFWKKIGLRKNWKVLCFGGGITQDVTTIAADLFLRNIDWFFFPTTLLSMCDSCIGGKCGINLGQYKNQIGVFYPPKKIYIDTAFINTLSKDDYLNGWGELLKFSLTDGEEFYQQIKMEKSYIPCEGIRDYIYQGLMVKKKVIEEDEYESDLRRVLNYGHTFGHALEAYTQNRIPHGMAVIWGIDVVNYIAKEENLISEALYFDVKKLIKEKFFKQEICIENPTELFEIIKTDKKVKGNVLNFALLDAPSHLIVYPMDIDNKLKERFLTYIAETHEYYND